MNKQEMREEIRNFFLSTISDRKIAEIFVLDHNDEIVKFVNSYSDKFGNKRDIEEYLHYVFDEIFSLNIFFKKSKKAPIPFSRFLKFANKNDRIVSWLTSREEIRTSDIIAGRKQIDNDYDQFKEMSKLLVPYKGCDYEAIYMDKGKTFYFSGEKRSLIVEMTSGKLVRFSRYKEKVIEPIKLKTIFNFLKSNKDKGLNSGMLSFMIMYRQKLIAIRNKRYVRNSSRGNKQKIFRKVSNR